jgi:hypothetical protein
MARAMAAGLGQHLSDFGAARVDLIQPHYSAILTQLCNFGRIEAVPLRLIIEP